MHRFTALLISSSLILGTFGVLAAETPVNQARTARPMTPGYTSDLAAFKRYQDQAVDAWIDTNTHITRTGGSPAGSATRPADEVVGAHARHHESGNP